MSGWRPLLWCIPKPCQDHWRYQESWALSSFHDFCGVLLVSVWLGMPYVIRLGFPMRWTYRRDLSMWVVYHTAASGHLLVQGSLLIITQAFISAAMTVVPERSKVFFFFLGGSFAGLHRAALTVRADLSVLTAHPFMAAPVCPSRTPVCLFTAQYVPPQPTPGSFCHQPEG